MNRIFDVVQSLSGQKNVIVIPVPYLDFFKSDQQSHMLAAILNQLVYWSGIPSSLDDGWFYKDYEELASEIRGVTADQVRKAAKKIIQNYLPGVIESTTRKVNGVPKKHWRLNGSALIARIFPQALVPTELSNGNGQEAESEGQRGELDSAVLPNGNGNAPAPAPHDGPLDSAELPNGNGQVAEWKWQYCRMETAKKPNPIFMQITTQIVTYRSKRLLVSRLRQPTRSQLIR